MAHLAKFFTTFMALLVPLAAHAEDSYFIASGEENGNPVIFRSMTAMPAEVHEIELPHRVVIRWRYETHSNGMPASGSYNGQMALEDALVPLDVNEIGRQVVVMTGDNRKEWHWYVKDFDSWMIELNRRLEGSSAFPIDISHTYEPDWSSFKTFLVDVNRP